MSGVSSVHVAPRRDAGHRRAPPHRIAINLFVVTMVAPTNSNETYCTFTLASDVTAGGLPSEQDIAKDLESSDDNVGGVLYLKNGYLDRCRGVARINDIHFF